jgi:hypothetical protein
VEAHIKEILAKAPKTDWQVRYQAARYLLDAGKDMPKAMTLVEESIKIRRTPQNLFLKARIQRWAGRAAEGGATLDQAIELATKEKASPTLLNLMEDTRREWRKAAPGR